MRELVSVVPSGRSRSHGWTHAWAFGPLAAALGARLRSWRGRDAAPDCSRRAAIIYLVLFVPALAIILLANSKFNWINNDAVFLYSSLEKLERFSSLFSNANANPLQGLFDVLPSGLRAGALPSIIGRLLGPGVHVDLFLIVSGLVFAYAVTAMARAAEMAWGVAVLAGFLVALLLLPTFGMFPLGDHMYVLWPIIYYAHGLAVLATALLWQIDGRSWRRDALLTAFIVVILLHLSMISIMFTTLWAPATLALGVGALAASTSKKEISAKIICALAVVVVLGGAGIFHYLYATGLNTARYVFFQELMDFMNFGAPSWSVFKDDINYVIMNPFKFYYFNSINFDGLVFPIAQLGAIHLAVFGKTGRARVLGRTIIVWTLATALVIAFVHNLFYYTGLVYQGPDPRHLVSILYPYYAICLASLALALLQGSARLLSRYWPAASVVRSYAPHALAIIVLAGPVAFIAIYRLAWPNDPLGPEIHKTGLPPFHEYQRTPIIDYLEPKIGVAIDRDFRGSALTMPTEFNNDRKPYGPWFREGTFTYLRAYLGNDMGTFGLHHYNIPTLDEESHSITPQLYLVARELLTRPGTDAYDKHYAYVTRLNEPILTLLGLRYVIADHDLPVGTQRFMMPIPEAAQAALAADRQTKSPLRVYELSNPNVGNYSPTTVVHANTARAMIRTMASPTFDGRQIVLTDDGTLGKNLVAATGAAMTVRVGGVALRASSAGESILVLPVQYSHCWQITEGIGATLFRANLMQLGVRFSGELRIELRQFFGPFWQSSCRLADAADNRRLRMAEALGAGAEGLKIQGDGINRIPSPEALETQFGSDGLASIKPISPSNAHSREYRMTPEGGLSEHYSGLRISNLTPGPYTLSMLVRTKETKRVALQVKDAGNNGAVVDYSLEAREKTFTIHKLNAGENLNATIEKIDDDWIGLTVTAKVATEACDIYIHVGGFPGYMPKDEAAIFRAVMLERGETHSFDDVISDSQRDQSAPPDRRNPN